MKNVGTIDKVGRVIAGLVIIGAGIYTQSWWAAIGLVPIGTAIVGVCPGYMPFGISTCGVAAKPEGTPAE